MNVTALTWTPYRIPYASRFATAHGRMAVREGLILRIETDAGRTGCGEAAPVPEFGGGTAADAAAALAELAPTVHGRPVAALLEHLATLSLDHPGLPAARAALETAALDVLAQQQGVPLAALLAPAPETVVPVNATIGATETADAVAVAHAAVRAGFGTVKLKVGVAASLDAEVDRVAAVRDAIGSAVALRLDANGAWSPETAVTLLRRLAAYDIELVEQPVAADDLAGLAAVRRAVPIPVAADEAATTIDAVRAVIAAEAADVVVIKPMVAGGPRAARAIIDEAIAAGLRVVVTSAIEAGIGVAMALHLAGTLPEPRLACGLATGPLLESDLLLAPLPVAQGAMRLPAGPGLGVRVDPEALARYGARSETE